MKEFIERVKKPYRSRGEFGDALSLQDVSNSFSLKFSVIYSIKKSIEVLGLLFEDCITLAHYESCPFYHTVIDRNVNVQCLNLK